VLSFQSLVLCYGASIRCAANVLGWLAALTGHDDLAPAGSTGRIWLMRLGLAAVTRPKVVADDWAWLIDHSIQIGTCKCLVILGVRLSELPEGRALCHRDLEPIALVPMEDSTKQAVAACLEEARPRTGTPRLIVDDHGADLHGGVEIFRAAYPETVEVYDITHKAACLLKARLEGDQRWKSYATGLGRAKSAVQQTELAALAPPSQRSKARFMNVGKLVGWGVATLALVEDPARLASLGIATGRAREKLGWLGEYREPLREWSSYQGVIDGALDFVRRRGLYAGVEIDLGAVVPAQSGPAEGLRQELLDFVRGEGLKARPGERLLGTTEVVESCFGKLKALEDGQSKSGFTGLVLSLGAMVSDWTAESVGAALERCRVRDVLDWCRTKLGRTVQSQRKQAYGPVGGATNSG
jgi:hypothetical protein